MKTNFTKVKVGDYMLNDGTTVSPIEMTEEQKSQAIGIVAYLYEEKKNEFLRDGVKNSLKAKGIENPHGLVIALENAGGKKEYKWSKKDYPTTENKTINEQIYHGVDGLEMTNNQTNIEDFPAFKAAKEYEKEVQAPENTTGWYLPSLGEWFCMLDHYEEFEKYIVKDGFYWTSSEQSSIYAYNIYFYDDGDYLQGRAYRINTFFIRPVLAF